MPTLQGDGATLEEMQRMSEAANEWMAFVLVTIGVSAPLCSLRTMASLSCIPSSSLWLPWREGMLRAQDEGVKVADSFSPTKQSFLLIGSCLAYWRAVRFVYPST
jgi:hypothetical protein